MRAAGASAVLAAALAASAPMAGAQSDPLLQSPRTESADAAVMGDPDAPVTVIEYASVTCPHCADFHRELFPHVKARWIDPGHAKFVIRPLPTEPFALAIAGFSMARCAGPDRYFDVFDDLLETQEELFAAQARGEWDLYYEDIAQQNGMSLGEWLDCLTDRAGAQAQIEAAQIAAQRDGARGTPTFVINGVTYNTVALQSPAAWDAAMTVALMQARDAAAEGDGAQ